MADAKQILVVDDHFEMLEFLRSMLELSNRDYQVVGVPSGEEGYLELRRTPFDLLITDVRLPGMSGFELLRKVRPFRPGMPVIMITAYSSAQGKQEATDLGVFRYFQKPLNTDALLTSVRAALHGEEVQAVGVVSQPAGAGNLSSAAKSLATDIRNRLEVLRTDTGASQVILAKADGTTLFEIGNVPGLALAPLVRIVAGSLDNSFRLAEQLGSTEPFNIQYQAGQQVDLYSANIGRDYFLMIIYDARSRRGRIGTVWVFAQRTIKELQPLLNNRGAEATPPVQAQPDLRPAAPQSRPVQAQPDLRPAAPQSRPVQTQPEVRPAAPQSRPVQTQPEVRPAAPQSRPVQTQPEVRPAAPPSRPVQTQPEVRPAAPQSRPVQTQSEVRPAVPQSRPVQTQPEVRPAVPQSRPVQAQPEPELPKAPTPEEIAAANELAKFLETKAPIGHIDLDSFWSEATYNEDMGGTSGLSLQEAIRRGLIPPEFGEK